MRAKLIGFLLIILLFALAGLGVNYITPLLKEKEQTSTSDADKGKGRIRFALDSWIGYFPFLSPEFKNRLRREGWVIQYDDNPDIKRRMELVAKGELDFAVFDVSSDILKGAEYNFPAVIIAVNDISVGGDSIWARADKVPNIDVLKGNANLRIAFTPDSPSHHFLKAASFHFAVPEIIPPKGDPRRVEVNGSEEALKMLMSGAVDVAVIWEPDGSRAKVVKGLTKLLGTEDTDKLIVDVLLVSRKFADNNPEVVRLVLKTYFQVLNHYRSNPDILNKHVRDETKLSEVEVKDMLSGVYWPTLTENCEKWFGIAMPGVTPEYGLIETVESTVKILINAKDFSGNPIPNGDPNRLTQSRFLAELYAQEISTVSPSSTPGSIKGGNPLEEKYPPLDEAGWKSKKEVGSLNVSNVMFQPGTSELDYMAQQVMDEAMDKFKHHRKVRLIIKGHTSAAGDPQENLILSQERAEAVARYLQVVYNVDPNRLRSIGFGGMEPLARQPNESKRSWEYRLPRVELVLVREDY